MDLSYMDETTIILTVLWGIVIVCVLAVIIIMIKELW